MKKLFVGAVLGVLSTQAMAGTLVCRLADPSQAVLVGLTYNITVRDLTVGAPFVLYSTPAGVTTDALQLAMANDPRIIWAEDDGKLSCPETEGQKKQPQKGSTLPAVGDRVTVTGLNVSLLQQINWNPNLTTVPGRAVRVAILDTGISPKSPYLYAKIDRWINTIDNTAPWDVPKGRDSNLDGIVDSKVGHGTMVAGIVDQVSPQSRLVICRVADSDGNATAWSVIKGLAFAVTANAELANVSLGAPARIPALSDVLDWCAEKRLTIVASAGNLGIETELYPANYSGVIGIAGLNVNKTKADFSCYDRKVIASAPAVGVASIDWDGGIATWSGTSFSSPIATGMIAEGLRRTGGRISPVRIEKGFSTYGDDLDKINPQYNRMLGSGLNFTKFVSAFKITGI